MLSEISGLLVPVIGLGTMCILFNQWVAVKNKNKMELFDRRMIVYSCVKSILVDMKLRREISDPRLAKYIEEVSCSMWLFDSDIGKYCKNKVVSLAVEYQCCFGDKVYRQGGELREHDIEAVSLKIREMYEEVETIFDKFMHLDKGEAKYFKELFWGIVSLISPVVRFVKLKFLCFKSIFVAMISRISRGCDRSK